MRLPPDAIDDVIGHTVKLMSPKYVKPCVKTNKNDYRDTKAICEAVSRPTMRFVSIKTVGGPPH